MKSLIGSSVAAVAAIVFTACGGGGGGSAESAASTQSLTGIFVDAAVSGLNYKCSSGSSAKTNVAGEYTCNNKDRVTFFLGKYELGACETVKIVSPYTLYPNSNRAAINVAQLLQTIDSDGDPSNGITVPEGFSELDNFSVRPTDASFDAEIQKLLSKTLIDEETAQTHLNDTLELPVAKAGFSAEWLEGKTLYSPFKDINDDDRDGETTDWILVASTYKKGLRSRDLLADGNYERVSDEFWVENGVLNIREDATLITKTIISADAIKITQKVLFNGVDTNQTEYAFYKKEDAHAYIVEMSHPCKCGIFTDIFIEGNTLYSVVPDTEDYNGDGNVTDLILLAENYENGYRRLDYAADGVFEMTSDSYEIIDGVLKISRGETWIKKAIRNVSLTNITVVITSSSGESEKTVYEFYNKADAQAYMSTL